MIHGQSMVSRKKQVKHLFEFFVCFFLELVFALDSVDETALHLFSNHEQIASFDNDWLSNNI